MLNNTEFLNKTNCKLKNEIMKNDGNLNELIDELKEINKNVSVNIEIISPKLAASYLLRNVSFHGRKNRDVSQRALNGYAKDILAGRWKLGAAIIFDDDDHLIDGQTRCGAVVKANRSIISFVIRGLEPTEVFDVIDSGKKRTFKDIGTTIVYEGNFLTKPYGVTSAINLMVSVNRNHNFDKSRGFFTNSEMCEFIRKDFHYYNTPFKNNFFHKLRNNINLGIKESILAAFYYKMKKDFDNVDEFLKIITDNISSTPPIVREFRDIILMSKGKKSDERDFLSTKQIYELIELLFKYYQSPNGFNKRKHFSKIDLKELF